MKSKPNRQHRPRAKMGEWAKSPYPNLIRYKPSGNYFGRVRINGKLIRRSLETHVLTVAKLKLSDFLHSHRRLAIAMEHGYRVDISARFVDRRRVKVKELHLPSQAQFQEMAHHIETSGAGQSKDCAILFAFLAFSGLRIDEARHVIWKDVDFEKGLLHARVTKNGKDRRIPLNSSLRQLLEKMSAPIIQRINGGIGFASFRV